MNSRLGKRNVRLRGRVHLERGGMMRKPYTQLFVHLVWATWDRLPLLDYALWPRVYRCIQA